MSISLFGLLVVFLGIACVGLNYTYAVNVLFVLTVFGGVEAIGVGALGNSSILPASLFSVFVFFKSCTDRRFANNLVEAIGTKTAGYWLILLSGYALLSAIFFPRVMEGITRVYALERGRFGNSLIVDFPLGPSGGNVTQSVYVLGAVAIFFSLTSFLRYQAGYASIRKAVYLVAALHVFFGVADLITWLTGTGDLLSWLHTANYRVLTDAVKHGTKRITGSFVEASYYASFALPLYAYYLSMWRRGVDVYRARILSIALLLLLLLSTSGSAFVVLSVHTSILYAYDAYKSVLQGNAALLFRILFKIFLIVIAVLAMFLFFPEVAETFRSYLDEVIFNKLSSQSGIERAKWNAQAWLNFKETYFAGAGLGSTRASSYVFTLLGNVGLPGLLLFLAFIYRCLLTKIHRSYSELDYHTAQASRCALATAILSAFVSGGVYDLGVAFYIWAAAASACALPLFVYRRS